MNQTVIPRFSRLGFSLAAIFTVLSPITAAHASDLVNSITIGGEQTDRFPLQGGRGGANINRLGGFFSDLYYDRSRDVYYGLVDRGPGGGTIAYDARVEKFSLRVDRNTGAISNFQLLQTIAFKGENGQPLNGLNPKQLNGNASTLGNSTDPEGFVVAPNGHFYVSDEYGPWVKEFLPNGRYLRSFTTPDNLVPKEANGTVNYVDGRPTITTGRQDNRGFEGLAISPDGSKLYAILQDPLVNEGNPDGRRGFNVRLIVFSTATGNSIAQYIYPLESLTEINDRLPGTENDFAANAQGRNIGVSSLTALNDEEFLVLERDNRGVGVDDPTGKAPVGSKRIYKIDITGATDVSKIDLTGTSTLPAGVNPVKKSAAPFIDIASALQQTGLPIPEKLEGLAIGPRLKDNSYALIVGTDNDFSVTQNDSGTQFDVCSSGTQVAIDSGCPSGSALLPTRVYSFKAALPDYVMPKSRPVSAALGASLLAALGMLRLKQ